MSNHTPGPWKVYQITEKNKKDDGYTCHVVTDEEYPKGFCVAKVHANSIFQRDVESNARLIAAAPELLEVLEKVLRYTEDMLMDEFRADDLSDWPWVEEAHKVISKAKGESP